MQKALNGAPTSSPTHWQLRNSGPAWVGSKVTSFQNHPGRLKGKHRVPKVTSEEPLQKYPLCWAQQLPPFRDGLHTFGPFGPLVRGYPLGTKKPGISEEPRLLRRRCPATPASFRHKMPHPRPIFWFKGRPSQRLSC